VDEVRLAESPGAIAHPTAEVGRFVLFTVSLAATQQPDNCFLSTMCSASVTENLNSSLRTLRDEDAWVWILGDDHCWMSDTLVRMLEIMDEHPEIDVLVPLVTKRNPPWHLVVFDELGTLDEEGHPQFEPVKWEDVPSTGVWEIDAAGSAGMLIRREVVDAVSDPWFYSTLDNEGRQVTLNEDVTFCTRIRHDYGFRIFATSDVTMGHLGIFNVRPYWRASEERWGALTEFSTPQEQFRHMFMPVEEAVSG
jgi:hypothetical protein